MEKLVREYIENQPVARQSKLNQLYEIISEEMPDNYEEKISYGMPTFHFHKNIIHFANFKNHIGIYPGPKAIVAFKDQLTDYKTSIGAIQLPVDQPLPVQLIKKIVQCNLQNA
ncbi:iron chaperone [Lentilactobacillus otakiensis]|uniref:iron chaperone n=1 Tax=Lentilactobacillus otakiensis TaxID=481720 RepID=UPI003D1669D2